MQPTKKTCGTCYNWIHDPENPEKRIGLCDAHPESYGKFTARMRNDKACCNWGEKK
ncbi:hypothetical protein [Methanorbis furvi]|uniref:Uncharacterized protein n=1 Tax=Methanorbis furvi TaxID=3028299 RepID=A0AAE4SB55_9EURY|nr:hypothetical protein [Methanocorpusculaceae archaeon Ag1]